MALLTSIRRGRWLLLWLLLATTLDHLSLLPALAAPAPPLLTDRHPDSGIWVAYRGDNSVADLQKPAIKGVMAYAPWNKLYVSEGNFNWTKLDTMLDFAINKVGKKSFVEVTVGYCPELEWPAFMRAQVASRTTPNNKDCHPLQFWDPVYTTYYKSYIQALADHLAQFDSSDANPTATDILFVRAHPMAETMENLPNSEDYGDWQWQDFTPATNGRIYQVDLSQEVVDAYDRDIVLTYYQELQRAYQARGLVSPTPVADGGTYWGPNNNRDLFVSTGIWFDKHNGSPSPQGWYYDMIQKVRSGETRASFESGNNWPDDLLGQYTYWEVLAALHSGIEFIGLYGTNKSAPQLQPKGPVGFVDNDETLAFGARYAGYLRNPAGSPGAWIALRGGYPEERWAGNIHQVRIWTNYDFLLTQYHPQDSVPLFGVENGNTDLQITVPVVTRTTPLPWPDEVAVCSNRYSVAECEFLYNQPTVALGQTNGRYRYTFPQTDLGQTPFCGGNIFCENRAAVTRLERMLWARRTDKASGHNLMRFALNDQFAATLSGSVNVRIVYLDQGVGKWELRYDGATAVEQSALVVQKQNTNRWKEVVVTLTDARFANRQEGGNDLTLYNMDDDDDIFHMIEVMRPAPPPASQIYLPIAAG